MAHEKRGNASAKEELKAQSISSSNKYLFFVLGGVFVISSAREECFPIQGKRDWYRITMANRFHGDKKKINKEGQKRQTNKQTIKNMKTRIKVKWTLGGHENVQ